MPEQPAQYSLSLWLEGKIIPKKRPRHNGNHSFLPNAYRDWKNAAALLLRSQYNQKTIEKASITIKIYGDKRGDLDNLAGAVLDALVQAEVLKDDRINCVPELIVQYAGKGAPGAAIRITPLTEGKGKSQTIALPQTP